MQRQEESCPKDRSSTHRARESGTQREDKVWAFNPRVGGSSLSRPTIKLTSEDVVLIGIPRQFSRTFQHPDWGPGLTLAYALMLIWFRKAETPPRA